MAPSERQVESGGAEELTTPLLRTTNLKINPMIDIVGEYLLADRGCGADYCRKVMMLE